MAIHTFEYCSLHYLNQWLEYDRRFYQALTKGNEKDKFNALNEAASFYLHLSASILLKNPRK